MRSEVPWFPTFLRLCREKWVTLCQDWTTDNPLLPLLEAVLACDSYRQVVQLLQHHPWVDRQAIYELRTQARKNYPMSHEISHYNFHKADGIPDVGIQGSRIFQIEHYIGHDCWFSRPYGNESWTCGNAATRFESTRPRV